MLIEAEAYYTVDSPAFICYGSIKPFPPLSIKASGKFYEGQGNMLIKLLSTKIADARGYEVDQGASVRYLNEIF